MLISILIALFVKNIYQRLSKRELSKRGKTICVVRLDKTVGDTVMNSAFLKTLRELNPDSRIVLIMHKNTFSLVKNSTAVDEVKIYNPGDSLKYSLLNRLYYTLRFVCKELDCIPDITIVPRFDEDHNAAFISLFSLAPVRVAWSERVTLRKSLLNYSFDKLATKVVYSNVLQHEVERGTEILRAIYGSKVPLPQSLDTWLTANEVEDAKSKFVLNETGKKYICLGISSGHSPLKQWPLSYFKDLAVQLYAHDNTVVFVLLGAESDIEQGKAFMALFDQKVPILNCISETTLRETGAILNACHLYIGNDSGNVHLAAAANIPTIGLYGSSCSHRFSPWGKLCDVIAIEKECGPCSGGHVIDRCSVCIYEQPVCMQELKVTTVYEKCKNLF
jgi:ADP-heptose:LPS heptosyltransferase